MWICKKGHRKCKICDKARRINRQKYEALLKVYDAARKFSDEDDKYAQNPNDCDWDAAWDAMKDAIKALEKGE
jgi:hypothetical protein